jgi:membrane complex biogenesis BtpA family protein
MRDNRRRGPFRGAGSRRTGDEPAYRSGGESRPEPPKSRPAPYPERPRPTVPELFRGMKPVIGVVHLLPLPGSPGYKGSFLDLLDHALAEARAIEAGGASGVIVENFGDAPFYPDAAPPETIAAMTRLVTEIRKAVRIPVGVNVLRNDARGGVAVAAATGAGFVRVNVHTGVMVTDQGILAGRAFESVRLREVLRSRTLLFADIRVKHAAPLADFDLVDEAEDAVKRGRADALIITGPATGRPANLDLVRDIRKALPGVAVLVGSGVTPENAVEVLSVADGCIVGTAIKAEGRIENPVDPARLARIVAAAGNVAPRGTFEERPARAPRHEERAPRFEEPPPAPRAPERAPHFEEPPMQREEHPARFEDRPARFEEPPARRSPRTVGTPAAPHSGVEHSGVEVWEPRRDDAPPHVPTPTDEPAAPRAGLDPFVAQPSARPVDAGHDAGLTPAGNAVVVDSGNGTSTTDEVRFGRTGHRKRRR